MDFSMLDSTMSNNSSEYHGSGVLIISSEVECTASVDNATQLKSNNSTDGAVIDIYLEGSFNSNGCSFEEEDSPLENSLWDIRTKKEILETEVENQYTYGNNATFYCDEGGCSE